MSLKVSDNPSETIQKYPSKYILDKDYDLEIIVKSNGKNVVEVVLLDDNVDPKIAQLIIEAARRNYIENRFDPL